MFSFQSAEPPKMNSSRTRLQSAPQFLRDSVVFSDAQNESDVMTLDSAFSDSESGTPKFSPAFQTRSHVTKSSVSNSASPVEPTVSSFRVDQENDEMEIVEEESIHENGETVSESTTVASNPSPDNMRGISNAINQLRKWKENHEFKTEAKQVPLPEEIITGLISEFNLRASRSNPDSFKQLKSGDIDFVMECISDQVSLGLRCIEESIPAAKDAELTRDVLATVFCSLEASLLGFTIFGCMDLSGQEDVRDSA
jgi:hypothetical protein